MSRDLLALALANGAIVAAGHGVLRLAGIRPAARDLAWSVAIAYLAGAAAFGVLGSAALVLGLALDWWQILAGCALLFVVGLCWNNTSARRGRQPSGIEEACVGTTQALRGPLLLLPVAVITVLAVLAVDLAVQPIWTDDAWSIWAAKASSLAVLDGLDSAYLSSASVFSASYPLVVPVLELVPLRFAGFPNELIPLQLGLLFVAFPFALAALLRDRVNALVLWVVLLAVAVAPTLQIQAASAVADVPLAVFFALAGVAGWRWVELGEDSMLWLAGIFAAATVGAKVEGGLFVALLFVALAVAGARYRRPLRRFGLVAAAVVLSALPWELWSRIHSLEDAVSAAGELSPGGLGRIPSATGSMLRELADPSSWLVLVALAAVAVALALARRSGREAALFTSFVTLASLVALLLVYWATPLDFDYHVATSVRRVIVAPVLFAVAMTPLLLSRAQRSR